MKVYLVGLAGSGKTTLGKVLAEKLHIPFIDLDSEIEAREGVSIYEIFKKQGEDYFRKVEAALLEDLSSAHADFVMATGGGTPVFHNNMEKMNADGQTVFLDVPVNEITKRVLQSNLEDRPLLAGLGRDALKDKIQFLRTQRISFYSKATITLQGPAIHADDLLQALTKRGNPA
jgi:shikimate kinase